MSPSLSLDIRRSPLLLVGGILLFIGVIFVAIASVQFVADRRFSRDAVATQGTLLKKVVRTSIDRDSRGRSSRKTHYEATYSFSVEGQLYEGRDELSRARWDALSEGAPAEILYLPRDPASNRLAGPRPWLLNAVFGLLGLVLSGVGAGLVVRALRRAAVERRLREQGTSTSGTVTGVKQSNLKINDEYQWRVEYAYQDAGGQRHVGSFNASPDEAQQWKAGDTGVVRYDPAKPADVVWMGR